MAYMHITKADISQLTAIHAELIVHMQREMNPIRYANMFERASWLNDYMTRHRNARMRPSTRPLMPAS